MAQKHLEMQKFNCECTYSDVEYTQLTTITFCQSMNTRYSILFILRENTTVCGLSHNLKQCSPSLSPRETCLFLCSCTWGLWGVHKDAGWWKGFCKSHREIYLWFAAHSHLTGSILAKLATNGLFEYQKKIICRMLVKTELMPIFDINCGYSSIYLCVDAYRGLF